MLFDFSHKAELTSLAQVVRDLQAGAKPLGIDFFLVGATARDLLLHTAYGIDTGRQTQDVDFSVMVESWESFLALRAHLIQAKHFMERRHTPAYGLRHVATRLPLDIIPFGAIERADRTISWPPDFHTQLDCFGVREAFATTVTVALPKGVSLQVAPIPALALLKVMAWHSRHLEQPDKDAVDLLMYLRHYLDCGTLDRAARDHADLFDVADYDHEATGARLLGRDMAQWLGRPAAERALQILAPQADKNASLLMASQSGMNLESARKLIEAVCLGLNDVTNK